MRLKTTCLICTLSQGIMAYLLFASVMLASCRQQTGTLSAQQTNQTSIMKTRPLTAEEKHVIINKGTEAPFSGKYTSTNEIGSYNCRQCGQELFVSDSKFDSHCGWPSFDDAIAGAVNEVPDTDGCRTEIVCSNCGGHLGHVFEGEKFTPKDTRHCVNSISIEFSPAVAVQRDTVYFASGCFWGTEYMFQDQPGVISTRVGYIGGQKEKPTYEEVCTGRTGHAEAIELVYDPTKTDFRQLAKHFFETHDPTQIDRQGPDIGDQYRTEIFYTKLEQKVIAHELTEILLRKGQSVVTQLTPAGKFWSAEEYHQNYYLRKKSKPYCHFHESKF